MVVIVFIPCLTLSKFPCAPTLLSQYLEQLCFNNRMLAIIIDKSYMTTFIAVFCLIMTNILRSSSVDEGASYSIPGLELETVRPDSGKRRFARDEPLQGKLLEKIIVLVFCVKFYLLISITVVRVNDLKCFIEHELSYVLMYQISEFIFYSCHQILSCLRVFSPFVAHVIVNPM